MVHYRTSQHQAMYEAFSDGENIGGRSRETSEFTVILSEFSNPAAEMLHSVEDQGAIP